MPNLNELKFEITHIDESEILEKISKTFKLKKSDEITQKSSFYDTFEWLLFKKGVLFEQKDSDLVLTNTKTNEQYIQKNVKLYHLIKIEELKKLNLELDIENIIYPRTLLKKFATTFKFKNFEVKNSALKTTLRVLIVEISGEFEKNSEKIGKFLILKGLKGYEKQLFKATQIVKSKELVSVEENFFDLILKRLSIDTNFYKPSVKFAISGEMSARDSFKIISKELLNIMEQNEDGVKKDIDSEFLHDYRVAVRKIRALTSQLKKYFTDEEYLKLKNDFKEIGFYSGLVRDLDVYLLEIEDYKLMLPESMRDDLKPLFDYLSYEQQNEHKKLSKFLSSKNYKKSIDHFKHFLNSKDEVSEDAPTILKIAKKKISKLHSEILETGNSITDETPDERLHELRIEFKKIRYLIEFFDALFDAQKIAILVKELKIMQQILGAYQDLFVQREKLKAIVLKIENLPIATIMAIGKLSGDLELKQKSLRDEFYLKFKQFSRDENCAIFKELF